MRLLPLLLPLLLLTGCAGVDFIDLDDLPVTLDRTASAVRLVTPTSDKPIECVLGRLGADTLEGAASAIRHDSDDEASPLIGVSFGVCLLGADEAPTLPCGTHRALTLATAYAAQLPQAVVQGLRGESATLGGFALPGCDEAPPEEAPADPPEEAPAEPPEEAPAEPPEEVP